MPKIDLCQLCIKHMMVDTCQDGTCRDFSEFEPDVSAQWPEIYPPHQLSMAEFRDIGKAGRFAMVLWMIAKLRFEQCLCLEHGGL